MTATTKARKVERWIWPLVYGGLLALVLGLAVTARDESVGLGLMACGSLVAALGAALIFVRAGMEDEPGESP